MSKAEKLLKQAISRLAELSTDPSYIRGLRQRAARAASKKDALSLALIQSEVDARSTTAQNKAVEKAILDIFFALVAVQTESDANA